MPVLADSPETVNQFLVEEDYDNALKAVTEGLNKSPENRVMLLQKGFLLIKLRQLDDAESHYLSVIEILPDDPEPMNNLGVVYQLQRQYGKAINQLNQTVKKFPEFTQAYENLGDTYIQIATAQYIAGRNRSPENRNLVAKADLGQRFYLAAEENISKAMSRYQKSDQNESSATPNGTKKKDIESELADFLRSWVAAWSSKDVDAYLAHYSDAFEPSIANQSLDEWKTRKRKIINAAEFIKIRVENIKLEEQQDNKVVLSFKQDYESNTYQSDSRKKLELIKESDGWLIASEE